MKPTPKVQAAGAAGAGSVILVWVAGVVGLDIPPEVASAFTTFLAAGFAWLTKSPQ